MRSPSVAVLFVLVATACGAGNSGISRLAAAPAKPAAQPESIPFDYVGQSWIRVAADVGGTSTRVMFDTGGGITILSQALCKKMHCVSDGTASGQRMSGQTIEVPMSRVPYVEIAGHRIENARVAVIDTTSLLHPGLGVDGVVALDLFRDTPFTIDYANRRFVVETTTSRDERAKHGDAATVRVENDGPSTVLYLSLDVVADEAPAEMEVDTGSRDLILHARYMSKLGIDVLAPTTKHVDGTDETGNPFLRFFAPLPHEAQVHDLPQITVPAGSTTMFQKIIHDGLVGHAFLSTHTVTFDVAKAQMIFARP